jgi:hypothetical protein
VVLYFQGGSLRDTLKLPLMVKEIKRKVPFKPCHNSTELNIRIEEEEKKLEEKERKKQVSLQRTVEKIQKSEEKKAAKAKAVEERIEAARLKDAERLRKDQEKLEKQATKEKKKSEKLPLNKKQQVQVPPKRGRGRPRKVIQKRPLEESNDLDDIPLLQRQKSQKKSKNDIPQNKSMNFEEPVVSSQQRQKLKEASSRGVYKGPSLEMELLKNDKMRDFVNKQKKDREEEKALILNREIELQDLDLLNCQKYSYDKVLEMMQVFDSSVAQLVDQYKEVSNKYCKKEL